MTSIVDTYPVRMPERSRRLAAVAPVVERLALPVVLCVAAGLAISLQRTGHTQGDDFALYLRQARSIFDGDPGQVIADNRFSVVNSGPGFSPIGYPWGWPILLSPFVHLWGLDYDRLKLVEVAALVVWLTFLHGIVRRRLGRVAALVVTTVFATAPAYLAQTEQLITEIPHLAVLGVFLWWLDRLVQRGGLVRTTSGHLTRDLVWLGVAAAAVFNVRREGIVLFGVIAVVQIVDLVRDGAIRERVRTAWLTLVTPHLAFAGSVAFFQFLLPTALLPDNGNGFGNIPDRFGEYPVTLSDQLGCGLRGWVGLVLLGVAAVGVVVGVRRRPRLDGAILALAVFSALTIGTHFREVERYWFQVTPWVVYFVAVTCVEVVGALVARRPTIPRALATLPLAVLVVAHVVTLPGQIQDVRDFESAGRVLSGPTNPVVAPVYVAVREYTPPDAVVAFFRARTMTLLTDRRSIQTKRIDLIRDDADYFAQRRNSDYSQPTVAVASQQGFEVVWTDSEWILWRIPDDTTQIVNKETP